MNRPGHVVEVVGAGAATLIDRAAPSGWWAYVHGCQRPVRLILSKRRSDVAARWRLADAGRS